MSYAMTTMTQRPAGCLRISTASHFWKAALLSALALTGCGPVSPAGEEADPSTEPHAAAAEDGQKPEDEGEGTASVQRLAVGPVSFGLPENWEVRQALYTEGITMFAPERPQWKEIGFRANLGVRARPHEGFTPEKLRESIEEALSQSVEQANATVIAHARAATDGKLADLSLQEKRVFRLTPTEIDGVEALSTEFSGAFELQGQLIATQTYGLQILEREKLYSISLTFPQQFAAEMNPVWQAFVAGLKIDAEQFEQP